MPSIKIGRATIDRLPPASGSKPVYHFDQSLKGFAVRVSPRGVKAFLVQGYCNGKLQRRSLGRYPTISPEKARKRARDFLDALAGGDVPIQRRNLITMAAALDEWLDVHVARKLKRRTVEDYQRIVRTCLEPALGIRPVAEVTRGELAELHHARRETPRSANYILAVARSFFGYAEEAGYRPVDSNPAKRIRPFPERRRERFLSESELSSLAVELSAGTREGRISPFAAAAFMLCIYTGARRDEIRTLKWREVDLERRLLLLEDSKVGQRPIYLSEPAAAILTALPRIEGNPYVIAGQLPAQPVKDLTHTWIKVRKRAGLDDVRLHDLRHTFASVGAAESLSLPMIGRLLGHRVPATTARYAHLAADPVTAANERIGARLARVMGGKWPDPAEGGDTGE